MKPKVSKALLEVWEMKRTVCEETKDLRGPAYFRHMREEANRLFPGIRHSTASRCRTTHSELLGRVAEDRGEYGKK